MRVKNNKKVEATSVQGKKRYLVVIYMFFIFVSLPINLFWGFISLLMGIGYENATICTFQSDLFASILYDVIILTIQLIVSKLAYLGHKNKKQYMICKIISYIVFVIFICGQLIVAYNNYMYFFHGR